jgi:hypothetical protein
MTPISTEGPRRVDPLESLVNDYKFKLIGYIDEIVSEELDPQEVNNDPSAVKELIETISRRIKETESNNHKDSIESKEKSNGHFRPIKVLQPIRDSKGNLHGVGFGIEISSKEPGENYSINFLTLKGYSKPLDNLAQGIYSNSIPNIYHHRENGAIERLSRESIICTAPVYTSEIFRNMGISEEVKTDILEGVLASTEEN